MNSATLGCRLMPCAERVGSLSVYSIEKLSLGLEIEKSLDNGNASVPCAARVTNRDGLFELMTPWKSATLPAGPKLAEAA